MIVIALVVVAVLVGGAASAAVLLRPQGTDAVQASSTTAGDDLQHLVDGGSGTLRWRSVGETTGAWVETSRADARTVNRLRLSSAGERTFTSARITFSDGSALLVAPNARGEVDVTFPARTARAARLTVAQGVPGTRSVALASFSLSDDGAATPTGQPELSASASSTASGSTAAALVDGDPRSDKLGAEWLADPAEQTASATVRWSGTRQIAAVRLWGPTAAAFDPGYSAAAALNGTLKFSDGSTVRVSGVAGGADGSTTVAFTPRMVSSVTAILERTIPQAAIGLRALTVYTAGDTPSITSAGDTAATAAAAGTCDAGTASAGTAASGVISLICPATGTSVDGQAILRVAAPAGTALAAQVAGEGPRSALRRVASASAEADGTATLTFSTRRMEQGPFTVLVSAAAGALRPLHAQLYNRGGSTRVDPAASHDAGTLVWDEQFDSSPSISGTGAGATYGAVKPEYWGGSQFGDAVFDDPSSGAGTFSVVDGALRIKAQPIGDRTDPAGSNRQHLGGLLSSLRVGASGFSAQYGYYEARMMAPAGNGTWPAFWMMNDDSATKVSDRSTEVDAVELYGNRTKQTCHATHNYVAKQDGGSVRCIDTAIVNDWGVGWHTYGVRIQPGQAQFYVDGRHVMTQTGLSNSDQPFFFMANLALGGGWPVDLSPTGGQAELWIDSIRVYV